jgi:hypothetical protein
MKENDRSASLARRDFMGALLGAAAALRMVRLVHLEAAFPGVSSRPIVSFHLDQPYLDRSGTAVPYHPPAGARSAQIFSSLDEESLRRKHCYL